MKTNLDRLQERIDHIIGRLYCQGRPAKAVRVFERWLAWKKRVCGWAV